MAKSSTPRTDNLVKIIKGWSPSARANNLSFLCRKLEREKSFYRDTLEKIAQCQRKTSAQRLANSGLTFWDVLQREAQKRKIKEAN
jgi:hypothetical protein